jgi:hypothetical protein
MNKDRFKILEEIMNTRNYSVNIHTGEVYSKFNNYKPKSTKEFGGKYSYLGVNLWLKGKGYNYKIHEIVAYAGGLDIVDMTINHINGDKKDNSIFNLETLSRGDNLRHGHYNGLYKDGHRGSSNPRSVVNEVDVVRIREKYATGLITHKELGKEYGLSTSSITHICTGRTWANVGGPIRKQDKKV